MSEIDGVVREGEKERYGNDKCAKEKSEEARGTIVEARMKRRKGLRLFDPQSCSGRLRTRSLQRLIRECVGFVSAAMSTTSRGQS